MAHRPELSPQTSELGPSPPPTSTDVVKASKRRQECLQNQRRYRLRKKKKFEAKAEQLSELHIELTRLQDHAHLLKAKLLMRFIEAGMQRSNTIAAYWELFRFGLADQNGRHYTQQIDFVRNRMHDDMYVNGVQGSGNLLDQWRACQSLLSHFDAPNMQIQVFGAEQEYIVTTGVVLVQFNRDSIALVFPRLLAREDLVQLLLQRPAPCPLRVSCHFAGGKVQSMDLDINIIEGIRQCVSDQANVAEFYSVLDGAAAASHVTANGLLDQQTLEHMALELVPDDGASL
ncbi:hypothetical protein SDRG_08370 [Saprolegnia diclina VS20]|uniref:BZIP domain-containing protein n=1 Tax=Saprolegnia diclina (strain VS20) TaxID=1156394 RepID=T0RUX5_SAPDV|nr:hypothetical protein SDRG_08370 [Saprolegnia diclina VS20]EQC34162.1 hypothetical protein SDRG_08370 [Saprolegnia diclina VS20]|eukprot:XP_008612474.1 hypothetical protein SDRG_08370 [Saprolegnia diclina VS20]